MKKNLKKSIKFMINHPCETIIIGTSFAFLTYLFGKCIKKKILESELY